MFKFCPVIESKCAFASHDGEDLICGYNGMKVNDILLAIPKTKSLNKLKRLCPQVAKIKARRERTP